MYIFIWEKNLPEPATLLFKTYDEAKSAVENMRVSELPCVVIAHIEKLSKLTGSEFALQSQQQQEFLAAMRRRYAL